MDATATKDDHEEPRSLGTFWRRWGAWLGLAVVILLAGQVRWRLLDVPLERDEGEYATMGQLMLDGVPPYAEAYNMKLPGIYASYAVAMGVFGETRTGIRLGLLVANAVACLLVFLIGRRLLGQVGAVVAAAAFAFLSVSFGVQGVFANAEHFVLPWGLFGLLLLLRAEEREGIALVAASGFCMGLAFVVKQHGIGFPAFGGAYLVVRELMRRPREPRRALQRLGVFAAAALVPYALACLVLFLCGVFETFWFWTVEYAGAYAGGRSLDELWGRLRPKARFVMRNAPFLWGLAGAGLVLASAARDGRGRRTAAVFVPLLALVSFLAITPGLHFRPHYFVLLVPAAALAIGAVFRGGSALLERVAPPPVATGVAALVCAGALIHAIRDQWPFLIEASPDQVVFSTFGTNPFSESIPIANFIVEHTEPDDRIAVIGSEPQLYFYTHRRAATGFLYTYALMEPHRYALDMHKQMIAEIERNRPAILVIVKVKTSWLASERSEDLILRWAEGYKRDFERVGLMDLRDLREGGSRFYQGAALARYEGKPEQSVEIWQRKR